MFVIYSILIDVITLNMFFKVHKEVYERPNDSILESVLRLGSMD